MKSGICPKCGSREVYKYTAKNPRSSLNLSWFKVVLVHDYVCHDCGFIENYVAEEQLQQLRKNAQ